MLRSAKVQVAKVKQMMDNDRKEGETDLYRLVMQRHRNEKYVPQGRVIKNRYGNVRRGAKCVMRR